MRRSTALNRLAVVLLLLVAIFQIQAPAAQSSVCTDGQLMSVYVGPNCGCEGGFSTPQDRYRCVDGEWVFHASACGPPFCIG
jgi:hypothetical protein